MTEKNSTKEFVQHRTFEFILGLFFIGAVLILIYFTVFVDGKELLFKTKRYIVKVEFPSVASLSENDKVCVKGMKIGKVKAFDVSDDFERITVTLSLDKPVPFYKNYSIQIQDSSVFGGQYVAINPGTSALGKVESEQILKGNMPRDILNDASKLIELLKEDEKRFREEVLDTELLENINVAAKELNKGAQGFNEIITKIKEGEGALGQLMKDPEFYKHIKATLENVNSIVDAINQGQGTIGLMFKDTKLYNELNRLFVKINKSIDEFEKVTKTISSGKGTLGKLVYDDKAYNNFLQSLRSLKDVLNMLHDQKGSLGRFANDDGRLYNLVVDTLTSTKDLMKRLQEGKGTLGLLCNDDKLYYETKEAVKQLKETLQDFREQSPISTFGSMMFGTF